MDLLKKSILNRIQEVGKLQNDKHKEPQELVIVNLGCSWNRDDAFSFIIDHQNDIKEVHLVDAAPESIDRCRELYEKHVNPDFFKKIHFHQIAIVADPHISTTELFFPSDDTVSGFATTDRTIILSNLISQAKTLEEFEKMQTDPSTVKVTSLKVPCATINSFFKRCGLSTIDRLYIDLEGLDGHVLLDLDLDYFKIPFIMYEHLHLDGYENLQTRIDSIVLKTKNPIHERLHQKLEIYNFHIYAYGPWNAVALNEKTDLSLLIS
jgi:hypothetical protein